jgi:hypothetical protein
MLNTALKWTACAVTLAGAICTALRIDPMNIYLLNLGALMYLIWAVRIREWSLVTINAGLLIIYLVGLGYTHQLQEERALEAMGQASVMRELLTADGCECPKTEETVNERR